MPPFPQPHLPLPPPLRAAELGTFTHHSVVERLPGIGRRILAENSFPASLCAALEALIAEIPHAPLRPLHDAHAPDAAGWARYLQPYLARNWLETPWFFVETYFYRRVMEALDYFGEGEFAGYDPYHLQKRTGLETSLAALRPFAAHLDGWLQAGPPDQDTLAHLLRLVLWGNQADLSLWPAGQGQPPGDQTLVADQDHLLIDHAPAAAAYLLDRPTPLPRLDLILDNAGLELLFDLFLAAFLLTAGLAEQVHLHLKSHPTFVSDALIADVHQAIEFLLAAPHPPVRAWGRRLREQLDSRALHLHHHFYWTSPLPFWELPPSLHTDLTSSRLLIFKGDANYRRLLGDRHWPYTTPFADLLAYAPAPLFALRVLKSEVLIGLPPGRAAQLDRQYPRWMVNGQWGLIQSVGISPHNPP